MAKKETKKETKKVKEELIDYYPHISKEELDKAFATSLSESKDEINQVIQQFVGNMFSVGFVKGFNTAVKAYNEKK